jgi:hypothetical protein
LELIGKELGMFDHPDLPWDGDLATLSDRQLDQLIGHLERLTFGDDIAALKAAKRKAFGDDIPGLDAAPRQMLSAGEAIEVGAEPEDDPGRIKS